MFNRQNNNLQVCQHHEYMQIQTVTIVCSIKAYETTRDIIPFKLFLPSSSFRALLCVLTTTDTENQLLPP